MTDTRNTPSLPPLETHTLDVQGPDRKLIKKQITGRLIGSNSSEQPEHEPHEDEWAPQKFRCSACRWMEVDIYTDVTDGDRTYAYLVHTVGRSDVPGETDRPRYIPASNTMMVVGALVSRSGGRPQLTVAADMAMREAAGYDSELRDEVRQCGLI